MCISVSHRHAHADGGQKWVLGHLDLEVAICNVEAESYSRGACG